MSQDKYATELLEKIFQVLKALEEKINRLSEQIETLMMAIEERDISSNRIQVKGGRIINMELSKQEVLNLLLAEKKPMSAIEVSQKLNISRSYSSGLLNDLFREGKIDKIRVGKIIKFKIPNKLLE